MVKGDLKKAIEYNSKALIVRQEIGDRFGYAQSLGNKAGIKIRQGRWVEALDLSRKALKIFADMGAAREMAASLRNIARIEAVLAEQKTDEDEK